MNNLFSEFATVDKQAWHSKIEADTKKSIENFGWKINDKIVQSPFVRVEDLDHPITPIQRNAINNNWDINERISISKPVDANHDILTALEGGASAITMHFKRSLTKDEFASCFKGVNFTYISTTLEVADQLLADGLISHLIDFCKTNNQDTSQVKGDLGIANQLLFDGTPLEKKYQSDLSNFAFSYCSTDNLYGYSECVIYEVASIMLGLITLLESDIDSPIIRMEVNIGKSYLLNISKLRAIHLLTRNLCKAFNKIPRIRINARIPMNSISENENHNLIQLTSQAMSAVIGGVNSLCLPPSDISNSQSGTPFRVRLSRNIQSIMQQESFMNKVSDPAAGSYYLEKLTEQIAEQAWEYLQNHSE